MLWCRKFLWWHSISDRWASEYGTLMEWYWKGWTKVLYLEKILSQCLFVYHEVHVNWLGIKHRSLWWEADNHLLDSWLDPRRKCWIQHHVDYQGEPLGSYIDSTFEENLAAAVLNVKHEFSVCVIEKAGNNCFHHFKRFHFPVLSNQ